MATKLGKSAFPAGHSPEDFSAFGPPAVKDGQFQGTMICDCGCFNQEGVDSNKYYHAAVVQSKKDSKWYAYFEWGRVGAKNPQFQFVECGTKDEACREYESQLHEKNTKRGQWVNHPTLGNILQAKAGKDCYLVRPQATRSTGLPDARTIKYNEGTASKPLPAKSDVKKTVKKSPTADPYTLKLMRDLNVATVSYTRGVMTDASLPTLAAIEEARDILTAAQNRLKFVGDNVDDQVKDTEIVSLTRLMYGRIPKKKERNADPSTWILSKDNVLMWQQDLDAFESALNITDADADEKDNDPFNGMKIAMHWLDPKTSIGEFIYNWAPRATRNKHHGIGQMKVKNIWYVERHDESTPFDAELKSIAKSMPKAWNNERPLHQRKDRPDLNADQQNAFWDTNTGLVFHGTRSVNVSGILNTGFRFPKELVGVVITGAMFGGGTYFADDWKKSAGYTSFRGSYWSAGAGAVKGRDAFMFVCDCTMGVPHVAPGPHPYTNYPKNTNSIFGKAGHSQVQNNEWIIFKKQQQRLRYLIEFDV